jgi:hypothetical protein
MSLYFYLAVLTGCLIATLIQRRYLNDHFRWIFWLICITWVVEMMGFYSLHTFNKVAGLVFHIFQPVEYSLVAIYFLSILKNKWLKKLILTSLPAVYIFNVLNLILWQDIRQLNTYSFLVVAFLFSIWAIFYLHQLLTNEIEHEKIWQNPDFWVATGILFFYTGAFFLMGFINTILHNNRVLATKLFSINHILNILLYSLYTIGITIRAKWEKQQSL